MRLDLPVDSMARHISTAAVYRPVFDIVGRRRAGPDEDGFTLAVAAGELLEPTADTREVARIHYFGPPQLPEAAAMLPMALGMPAAHAERREPTAEAFARVLKEELHEPGDGAALLIAVDVGPHRPVPEGPRVGGGGAVALRIGPDPVGASGGAGPERLPDGLLLGGEESAVRAALGLRGSASPVPWFARSGLPRPIPEAPWALEADGRLDARSEGAYVPRATYLENLPSRWRFAADRCAACGVLTFPLRGYCRGCGAAKGLLREELSRRGGTVEAVTTIHPGAQPTEFDGMVTHTGSYDVLLVALVPGGRVTLQGTDRPPEGFRIGAKVDTVLRRLYPMEGEWRYGRKAVPAYG
ncbi:MAG: Zn-ribbon domain-containing OB-fold protein [Thermoplasmata archaeon]